MSFVVVKGEGGIAWDWRLLGKIPRRALIPSAITLLFLSLGALARGDSEVPIEPPRESTEVSAYGEVHFDFFYATRNNSPLDPVPFDTLATAAGEEKTGSTMLSPRSSTFGVKARSGPARAVGEIDLFGGGGSGAIEPRLRRAHMEYAQRGSSVTAGVDGVPILSLEPHTIDYSRMAYAGNAWNFLPQITYRTVAYRGMGILGALFRSARSDKIDPRKWPYLAGRVSTEAIVPVGLSGAYRPYRESETNARIHSYMAGLEASAHLKGVTLSAEMAYGQALGGEFYRYGQELAPREQGPPRPISTLLAWADAQYSPTGATIATAGYGMDNPRDKDLQYVQIKTYYALNQRAFVNLFYQLAHGFRLGAEATLLMTRWVVPMDARKDRLNFETKSYRGQQYTLSAVYSFPE